MPAQATWSSQKTRLWLLIGAGVLLLIAANSHLVYVAMVSQPDCVAHLRQADDKREIGHGRFRAAISSCSLQ